MFDLGALRLSTGEGRRLELNVGDRPVRAGRRALRGASPTLVPVRLDISRTTGDGYALRLRFDGRRSSGPCMRCLEPADAGFRGRRARGSQPEARARSSTPRMSNAEMLDLAPGRAMRSRWRCRRQLLCRADCAGLCPVCGANLNARRSRASPRARAGPALGEALRAPLRLTARGARLRGSEPRRAAPASLAAAHGRPQAEAVARPHGPAPGAAQARRAAYNACPQCHSPRLPHRVCPVCGSYKGREVRRRSAGEQTV